MATTVDTLRAITVDMLRLIIADMLQHIMVMGIVGSIGRRTFTTADRDILAVGIEAGATAGEHLSILTLHTPLRPYRNGV